MRGKKMTARENFTDKKGFGNSFPKPCENAYLASTSASPAVRKKSRISSRQRL